MPHPLACLLDPGSVAVIGASDNIHKIGGRPIHYMRRHGYQGRLYPINPGRTQVQGLVSHARLGELPETPELALIAVGGMQAMEAVRECAAAGVKAAVVMASGFGETGEDGWQLRPLLVGKDTKMPDYIVLISTLGGMALFGLTGFVIGPVIAALFMAIWDMFTRMQLQDEERRRQLASTSEAHAEYQLSDNMSSEDPSRR
jgi:hypothetical protein